MKKIATALEPLDEAARVRALQWAVSRFRTTTSVASSNAVPVRRAIEDLDGAGAPAVDKSFAELFAAARPKTERQKALVASYWLQVCQNQPSFASQAINAHLKDLGHGVGNITEALTQLKNERPALALQLKKSGTSKQARKTYKLTLEGINRVDAMTRGDSAGE